MENLLTPHIIERILAYGVKDGGTKVKAVERGKLVKNTRLEKKK